jgi:c-di-GMP-binding flagellar brake protein YcgR
MTGPQAAPRWKVSRSFPRFAVNIPLSVSGTRRAAPIVGRVADIGLGGLCGMLPDPVTVGERLNLEFTLPRERTPIRVLAKVRYSLGERHGFQFLNLDPEQRERIRRACEKLTII